MNKHTPGPWKTSGEYEVVIYGKNKRIIARTDHHFEEDHANAALISQAPEMYRLLRYCEVELMPDEEGGNAELWEQIRKVLAKIDGE